LMSSLNLFFLCSRRHEEIFFNELSNKREIDICGIELSHVPPTVCPLQRDDANVCLHDDWKRVWYPFPGCRGDVNMA
jgi:hypothetical protein